VAIEEAKKKRKNI